MTDTKKNGGEMPSCCYVSQMSHQLCQDLDRPNQAHMMKISQIDYIRSFIFVIQLLLF